VPKPIYIGNLFNSELHLSLYQEEVRRIKQGRRTLMSINNIQPPSVTGLSAGTQGLYNTLANVNLEMSALSGIVSAINSNQNIQSSATKASAQASNLTKGLALDIKDLKGNLLEMTPAEAAARGYVIKNGDQILVDGKQSMPIPAGSGYGGLFEQGLGTSFNINPTQAWNGAGAFPQYAVDPNGRIVPNVNFIDRTAGAGMTFGLPPSINDVEANLKGIDPFNYGRPAYAMPPAGATASGPVTLGSLKTSMTAPSFNPTALSPAGGLNGLQGENAELLMLISLLKLLGISPTDLANTALSTLQGKTPTKVEAATLPLVDASLTKAS
jgi:hypothetical protein